MPPILIEIRLDRTGFDRFIGSWVCRFEKTVVIDVGPSSSVIKLIDSLKAMGIHHVDYVLLTHIHMDHAGGLGEFLDHFTTARAICHSKAVSHLLDPSKLWANSQKTLGNLAIAYGPMKPVKKERLLAHTEARVEGVDIIETPGHAPHHLSFVILGHLFVGEAGGTYVAREGWEYLRPATPPVFFLKEFLRSIDLLLARGELPICYAHLGSAQSSQQMLKRERDQLLFWEHVLRDELGKGDHGLMERGLTRLLREDKELQEIKAMSSGEQERERFFLGNSIKGYLGFLQDIHPL
jgi:glyoxylase-like metal-dependent hydrolase (beta-lactamase superfamily II)